MIKPKSEYDSSFSILYDMLLKQEGTSDYLSTIGKKLDDGISVSSTNDNNIVNALNTINDTIANKEITNKETIIEKPVFVDKPFVVEVDKPYIVEVDKPYIVEKERTVEKPFIVEVEKPFIVEKEIRVEKEVPIEKTVVVEKPVIKVVKQPVREIIYKDRIQYRDRVIYKSDNNKESIVIPNSSRTNKCQCMKDWIKQENDSSWYENYVKYKTGGKKSVSEYLNDCKRYS